MSKDWSKAALYEEIQGQRRRIADMEAKMRGLVDFDPIEDSDNGADFCRYCFANARGPITNRTCEHTEDCAWVLARSALGSP